MKRSNSSIARRVATGLALAAALSFGAGDAFARAGGGKSFGSRGSMSRTAPPATDTAPRTAQPLPGAQSPSPGMAAGGAAAASKASGSRFGGLMGGFAMGFLGAGLFGLLTGQGFLGGIGSLMGFLGLLLQVALVFFVARFAFNWWKNRNQPAVAGNAPDFRRQAAMPGMNAPGMTTPGAGSASVPQVQPLQLAEVDFNAFERLLGEVQAAYSAVDRNALMLRATPEMVENFGHDIGDLARRGLVNRISNVKLLQGDLAEAWREPGAEYATVAMRFALTDVKVEQATGRIVEGDPNRTEEATELWTFVRRPGESPEGWRLSAIQQA
ncbi:MAG: TIM44-like domain-containing protein [Proteobacteria bacterium]|nr:TIM44-like domain-containing protein [Pseudomonadota bacterium]